MKRLQLVALICVTSVVSAGIPIWLLAGKGQTTAKPDSVAVVQQTKAKPTPKQQPMFEKEDPLRDEYAAVFLYTQSMAKNYWALNRTVRVHHKDRLEYEINLKSLKDLELKWYKKLDDVQNILLKISGKSTASIKDCTPSQVRKMAIEFKKIDDEFVIAANLICDRAIKKMPPRFHVTDEGIKMFSGELDFEIQGVLENIDFVGKDAIKSILAE